MDSEVFVAASFVWVGLIVSHHKTSDTLRLALYQLINVNWQNYEQEIMPQSQLVRYSNDYSNDNTHQQCFLQFRLAVILSFDHNMLGICYPCELLYRPFYYHC